MGSTRWRKAARDLWTNKTRTILVVLVIAISVFGVGAVLGAYSILTREIRANYMGTDPASATLVTDGVVDEGLVRAASERPSIADAEARRTVVARAKVGQNEWRTIVLFVVENFGSRSVSTFEPEAGAWPPQGREMLVERSAVPVLGAGVGDEVVMKTPEGPEKTLPVAGTVHDPGQSPGWMDNVGYGYVTPETLRWLGESGGLDELKIVVNGGAPGEVPDEARVETVAQDTAAWLQGEGREVSRIEVPPPGEHPHQAQMTALLFLLGTFGMMALVLSGVLVANMISAMLAQQVRQIGVMKAVGASTGQVIGVYLGMILVLSAIALVLAVPAGMVAAREGSVLAAGLLNFDITSFAIPPWVFAVQVALGLLVPLVMAAYPVWRGSRITVREAISDYGVGAGASGQDHVESLLGRLGGVLSRPLMLSLRNAFRRRARLILTLAALAGGGAVFMAALNVSASWDKTLDAAFDTRPYDVEVRLERPENANRLEEIASGVPDVARAEAWGYAEAARAHPGETEVVRSYPGGIHGGFGVVGVPEDTKLVEPNVVEGRWLGKGDADGVVVNRALLEDEPDLKIGDDLTLEAGGKKADWRIVGIVEELGTPATAYATYDAFAGAVGRPGEASDLRVDAGTPGAEDEVARGLESALGRSDVEVASTQETPVLRASFDEHIVILVSALMAMAALVAAVGGVGLASTMSVNVMERTRELGVMQAIGATPRAVLGIVVAEGVLIGALSWLLALALSLPLSAFVGFVAGQVGLGAPLDFGVSPLAMLLWLGIVVVFAAAASFYPAWSASRTTVRETLAYE